MEELTKVVRKSVHEVLDRYLCGELLRDLENHLVHTLEWDLVSRFDFKPVPEREDE